MKMALAAWLLALVLILSSVSMAVMNVSLSDQGTGVTYINGTILATGNINILIYNVSTGGSPIWNNTYNITNGSWNVMMYDIPLDTNTVYWKDYIINGDDLDFDGVDRLNFTSPVGSINWADILGVPAYILNESDPLWSANYTLFNDSWSSTYNATYDALIGEPLWSGNESSVARTGSDTCPAGQVVQNVTTTTSGVSTACVTPTAVETDPLWSGNMTAVYNETLWSGNYSLFNDSWSSTYNATYDGLIGEPLWSGNESAVARIGDCGPGELVQNTTTTGVECTAPTVNETDPLWSGNMTAVYNETLWSGNYTLFNASWSSTYNATYDAKVSDNSSWNQSLADTLYAKYSFGNNNFSGTGNFTTEGNITVGYGGYLFGQPLLGMMGSGLIESTQDSGSKTSDINVTCAGLSCTYNSFRVRIMQGNAAQYAKYCNVSNGTLVVPDNTFATYYVDSNCAVQQTTYDTWFTSTMKNGGAWDFAYILTQNGNAEVIDSISLEQRRMMKQRILNYYTQQSKVISGFGIQTPTNLADGFNITAGKTVFGMDVVDVNKHIVNATPAYHIEMVGHGGDASNWSFNDNQYLNITHCDNGTAIVACTGSTYRRNFIFMIGYDGGLGSSELHSTYPLLSTSYSTVGQCLDTTTNPLTYTLPTQYAGANVMLYAYCSQRTSTTWNTANLIDLRTVKSGTATGGTDISGLVPYSGATANLDLGGYNLTATNITGSLNASNVLNAPWLTATPYQTQAAGWNNLTNWTATDKDKGFLLNTTVVKPACSAAERGGFWFEQGAAGVTDLLWVCMKNSSNNYNWVLTARGD